jgi:hypothetical protein
VVDHFDRISGAADTPQLARIRQSLPSPVAVAGGHSYVSPDGSIPARFAFLSSSHIDRLAASVLEADEQRLLHSGATLATYGPIDDRSPMTREFEVSPLPEYAFLSKNALLIATDRRLLVGAEVDDGSAHVHLLIPCRAITGVRPPDLRGIHGLLATMRGQSYSTLADLNPAVEVHGDNEMIVILLPPSAIEQLIELLKQRSHATVLPSA